ncbi:UDP-3-O-acylglucosamine N-acyltransferase [Thiohalobacter sp. COW1]|uniref:UDP-3-O-acylglucosamine N-acyltransferase n=1 Tax=Thiohalobacter thiocyanaticus TaxID=585455 RepID=A0A1Z4VS38_9GAMM|nr:MULTISPECIES: UDP-3-O-(3-hydroxymyristoyl)glucosamine N-acyltransferase [Thiohalobacter]BAZ94450.1 UDP-3-O-(3-hydroxymyristoyl)-glucosamine N-acyltransferase [Thiohalobacter thiocyanaticus]BCO30481.1 UDP-3-O-acylglucosamine N-acyltransferase [Thiohalobacter sp. COW1]
MTWTLEALARQLEVRLVGDGATCIDGVCTLQQGREGGLSFLANTAYRKYLHNTRASAVIVADEDLADCPVPALVSDNPYATYARAATLLSELPAPAPGVHPSAVVHPQAQVDTSASVGPLCVIEAGAVIGEDCVLGPNCLVGRGARVGAGTRLVANVTLCHEVRLGRGCLLHPGVVIGSDGFGIAKDQGRWLKVPQLGGVEIGDDVEIGANTTVDRGALENTVIAGGAKLDNQIQVAHNVHIGEHTAVAGCVGISGSARIGSHCLLAGGVGVVGHLEIADHTVVTGMSMVTRSITEAGVYSSGLAAMPADKWNRIQARLRRLDDMARRLQSLEQQLTALRDGAIDKKSPDNEND